MKRKSSLLALVVLISSLVLSACMGLMPLQQQAPTGQFGPQTSTQEQQTRTFEALWGDLQSNYIYADTANVNWDALHSKYLEKIQAGLTPDEFVALIKQLQAELPTGTLLYESRAERIQSQTTDSSYEGIGAFIGFTEQPKPHIVLLDVIKGSPAEQAGLKAHDSIFAIDGTPILLQEGLAAVDRIRGPAGSTVTFEVQSPGAPQRTVQVKRGSLSGTGQLEATKIAGTNYGYLLFPPVGYDNLLQDVTQALQTLGANQPLDGLVLDLRVASSSGGWPLQELDGLFDTGTLAEAYNRKSTQPIDAQTQDVSNSQKVPLVILVGKNTEGFPEILAGSLQLHKRATVIGETTPGAIATAASFYLPDGSQVFVESTSFRLQPGSQEIQNTGIVPDISVNAGWDQVLPGQDPVLDHAIQYLDGHK